ncbi:MAG: OsmC family protein [Planctomycetota bacterium]|jgi:uncharacterized OsmC-like protein
MVVKGIVNGLDVDAMRKVIGQAMQHPEVADYKLRAHHTWLGGAHCRTSIRDFALGGEEDTSRGEPFVLDGDEPAALLGTNEGPNATEALLHALASCLSTTFMYHASAKGVEVEELRLELEGDIDLRGFLNVAPDVHPGFQAIRVTFHVKADASQEMIGELCDLARRHSPVHDTVTRPVPVTCELAGD